MGSKFFLLFSFSFFLKHVSSDMLLYLYRLTHRTITISFSDGAKVHQISRNDSRNNNIVKDGTIPDS